MTDVTRPFYSIDCKKKTKTWRKKIQNDLHDLNDECMSYEKVLLHYMYSEVQKLMQLWYKIVGFFQIKKNIVIWQLNFTKFTPSLEFISLFEKKKKNQYFTHY